MCRLSKGSKGSKCSKSSKSRKSSKSGKHQGRSKSKRGKLTEVRDNMRFRSFCSDLEDLYAEFPEDPDDCFIQDVERQTKRRKQEDLDAKESREQEEKRAREAREREKRELWEQRCYQVRNAMGLDSGERHFGIPEQPLHEPPSRFKVFSSQTNRQAITHWKARFQQICDMPVVNRSHSELRARLMMKLIRTMLPFLVSKMAGINNIDENRVSVDTFKELMAGVVVDGKLNTDLNKLMEYYNPCHADEVYNRTPAQKLCVILKCYSKSLPIVEFPRPRVDFWITDPVRHGIKYGGPLNWSKVNFALGNGGSVTRRIPANVIPPDGFLFLRAENADERDGVYPLQLSDLCHVLYTVLNDTETRAGRAAAAAAVATAAAATLATADA